MKNNSNRRRINDTLNFPKKRKKQLMNLHIFCNNLLLQLNCIYIYILRIEENCVLIITLDLRVESASYLIL